MAPRCWIEANDQLDEPLHACFSLANPVFTTSLRLANCAARYFLPAPVVQYGCRRSLDFTGRIQSGDYEGGMAPPSVAVPIHMVVGSHVDFSVDDRRGGEDLAVELVSRQDFQFHTAFQHNHHALLGRKVDLVVGGDG